MKPIRQLLLLGPALTGLLLLSGCPAEPESSTSDTHPGSYLDYRIISPSQGVVPLDQLKLVPGEVLTLEFPNLPPMLNDQVSQCEVSIPEDYSPDKPVPFFLWLSSQRGSSHISRAEGMVDFSKFVVATLPFPEGNRPLLAVKDKTIDSFWDYLRPMLEAIQEVVPNISDEVRVAAGSANGAHVIGSGIYLEWPGFVDYFTAYVLHAGGYAPGETYTGARGKPMLVIYGEQSEALAWQDKFNEQIENSGAELTFIAMPEDAHALSPAGRERIREWTDALLTDD